MAQHRIIPCQSWQEFKSVTITSLFGTEPFSRGVYLFRGHGSANWPLMSSFDRWYLGVGGNKANKVKVSERFISFFQKEAEGIDVDRSIWTDRVARLALAQHSGVPTRLLDWTESPYISAFFAFAGIALIPQPEPNVAVWCLDTRSEIWSKEFGVELLDIPSYGNDRLRNQLGRFTLLRAPFDTLEEYVSNFDGAESALTQFLIPSSDACAALADLDVMGINYSKVFPGLEGVARAARLRMLFER
ncbi:MAG TPA: FRG domain-containing protein [Pyrinomonadaceae bacterium]|nr:FRG domain-containing protein [Pyrinomonadaceae bacterium]